MSENMNRKVVGVLPNELEIKLPPFISSCYNHFDKIKEFIYNTGINLYGQERDNIDTTSKLLADQGFLVFSVDEIEQVKSLVIYIPEKISPKQLEYFEKRKEPFSQYIIEYLIKQSNGLFEHKYQDNLDRPVIDSLINDLKERLTTKEKNKTLIREKNNQ